MTDTKNNGANEGNGIAKKSSESKPMNVAKNNYSLPLNKLGGLSKDSTKMELDSPRAALLTPKPKVGPSMSMEATLTLHTKLASSMWTGRRQTSAKKRDGIPGVLKFAKEAGTAWNEATMNNHVADMFLILAEERYEKAKAKVESSTKLLKELLDVQNVFDGIGVMVNNKPFHYELKFNCPWGYLACGLLKKYDDLIRLALTAKHIGFLGDADWKILVNDVGRAFRGFLQSMDSFIPVPIDRVWFEQKMQGKMQKVYRHYSFADREMPNVPEDIFNGTRRPKVCPPIRTEQERMKAWERKGNFTNADMTDLVKRMPVRSADAKKARKEKFKAEARKETK